MNRTLRTRPARFATCLAGLAVTAVALTACGGDADEPEAAPTGEATVSQSPTEEPTGEPTEKPTEKPVDQEVAP